MSERSSDSEALTLPVAVALTFEPPQAKYRGSNRKIRKRVRWSDSAATMDRLTYGK